MSSGRRHCTGTLRTVIRPCFRTLGPVFVPLALFSYRYSALYSYRWLVSFVPSAHLHRARSQRPRQRRQPIGSRWAQAQDARRAEMELRAELEANRAGGDSLPHSGPRPQRFPRTEAVRESRIQPRRSSPRARVRLGARAPLVVHAPRVWRRTTAQAALTQATDHCARCLRPRCFARVCTLSPARIPAWAPP